MTDTSKAAKLLVKAKTFIEKGWTQGAWARDADGAEVDFEDYRACSWCAMGAISRAAMDEDLGHEETLAANNLLKHAIPEQYYRIASWNDRAARTKEDILETFDKAIALALPPEHAAEIRALAVLVNEGAGSVVTLDELWRLEAKYGRDDPDLVRCRAMIDFIAP